MASPSFLPLLLLPLLPFIPSLPAWGRPDEVTATYVQQLNEKPDANRLRSYHDRLGSVPHSAGSPGDAFVIDELADAFASFGLEVERHVFEAYLARPVSAQVEIVAPDTVTLPIRERALPEDPDTETGTLSFGFNAFSGSGDATGRVVYVNYGRVEDFARLRELGVDLTGAIAVARYGGNYRGYKAKFAEAAGAAALLIYTDPKDSGYAKGLPYPEGGFANESSIQRGSIKTLPYAGDPLTPFVEASPDAERLDPADVELPRIPVQPIGWGAAESILERMRGRALPPEWVTDWQGGLPFAYRLEGGDDLRVRVRVEQERALVRTANVIGTLRGSEAPDDWIVVGCHHDAWGHGAGDPLAGLICLLESARSFGALAAEGRRPRRTVHFAAWGAEEMGIIGSTEWCEANAEALGRRGVAYVNLDMAAMGPNFRSSASPLLKSAIERAAAVVPAARATDGATVLDRWAADGAAPFGALGGGSDHIGFACHLGIPSCSLAGGGSHGTSYHTAYDTRRWYRMVVGDDYEPALMVTRMTNALVAELADAPLLPLDPARYAPDVEGALRQLTARAEAVGVPFDAARLQDAFTAAAEALARAVPPGPESPAESRAEWNAALRGLERSWLDVAGLPDRPWFRSLYAASDPDSGYAAWILPGLRAVIERGDAEAVAAMVERYEAVARRLATALPQVAGTSE